MTCEQLRLYFEDPFRREGEFGAEAEHLAKCGDCTRFVERQRELGAGLRAVRESAPGISSSLDAAVVANYRKQMAEGTGAGESSARRHLAVLGWSAAAAAVVIAAVLLWPGGRASHAEKPKSAQVPASEFPAANAGAVEGTERAPERAPAHRGRRRSPVRSVAMADAPMPDGFRSLMYCDELSCGGPLEVIRVQLPTSGTALTPVANAANGAVFADVLVGPDGFARGIRIVP
jgi:hypothetical protein